MQYKSYSQIREPLKLVINKLLKTVMSPEKVSQNYKKLPQIKNYNRKQRKYLKQQEHGELDSEYSDESDGEQPYKNLDENQLQYLIRKKLINNKYCPDRLQAVTLQASQNKIPDDQQIDSLAQIVEAQPVESQSKVNQVNKIYQQDCKRHKNLTALSFIISELEKIQKQNKN